MVTAEWILIMVVGMKEIGKKAKNMDKVNIIIQMARNILVSGLTTKLMVKELASFQTGTYMKENGKSNKFMAKAV